MSDIRVVCVRCSKKFYHGQGGQSVSLQNRRFAEADRKATMIEIDTNTFQCPYCKRIINIEEKDDE